MQYRYTGYTAAGERVRGIVQAPDRLAAMDAALETAAVLTSIKPGVPRDSLWQALTRERGRPKPEELAQFFRQLGGAVAAGIPAASALGQQQEHTRGRMRDVLRSLHAQVFQGSALSEALQRLRLFPELAVHLVRAGEATGDLASACQRIALHLQAEAALRGRVARAMVYPLILLALLSAGGAILAGFVFPRQLPVLQGLGGSLPLPTRMLIILTGWVQGHGQTLLLLAAASAGGIALLLGTAIGRSLRDQMLWSLPLFGPITRAAAAARLCRTLAALLRAGVPLQLELLAASVGNRHAQARLLPALRRVVGGAGLADTLAAAAVLPPLAVQALATGAASGTLAETADQVAAYYEEATSAATAMLTEALTPLVTVVVAVAVLVFALAVYLPMVTILQHIR